MNLTLGDKVLIAIFAALTSIGAFISIPIPYVPFTMQFFFSSMSGIILGGKKGALSQLLYILIGLIGIPVFTKGGGPQYIFQPTFGYLIGLIIAAYVIGKVVEIKKNSFKNLLLANFFGIIVIYFIGVIYFYLINKFYLGLNITISLAIYNGILITLPGDIIKSILTALVGTRVINTIGIKVSL
ncbi:MAG: biotin transporter BioY [Clostridium sp.]|uniref:biotin transporter BioY n=1 Tax=Clostridium sp. TaxID=1506 RepID=UPI0025B9DBDE|nr:biotin transporter BioY [Clostridium sp.]MCF0148422.1 biotin transporter BioY [Clostridium sp.]